MNADTPQFPPPPENSADPECQNASTGLLSLPTELLLQIGQYLSQADWLSLAMLSRRLNSITLPLYFQHHGVEDLRGNLKIAFGDMNSFLPGLRIALFLDSVHEIEFVFRGHPFSQLLQDMGLAANLIRRLTHLDGVKLNFDHLVIRQLRSHPPNDMSTLSSHLSRLLDAIQAKSCTSVMLYYGQPAINVSFTYAPQRNESVPLPQRSKFAPIEAIALFIRGANFGRKKHESRVLDFSCPPLASLRTFHFASRLFLWSPLFTWTLKTLEQSSTSLVELSLRMNIQAVGWNRFLTHTSLPSLSKLAIASFDLGFSSLIMFFTRHPQITSLCLCNGQLFLTDPKPFPAGLLPALTRLCGPVDYISHLLKSEKAFQHLSYINISYINIWPLSGLLDLTGYEKQNEALEFVSKRISAERQIHLTIALFGESHYLGYTSQTLALPTSGVERTLWNVECLTLRSYSGMPMGYDPVPLARWLALYPALREVAFVREFFYPVFDEKSKLALVAAISEACPKMEYVAIGQERRSIESWVKSKGK
jgi:hypothetical protein